MAYNPNRVTIYQVAREANVSLATVSRVLNDTGLVAEEKKKAVQAAIDKLGYVPSSIARGLARSTTTTIAIVLPASNYSYISSMMDGMIDICKIYGYMPILLTYENREDAKQAVENVLRSQAEGIVLFNSDLTEEDLKGMSKIKLPIMIIGKDPLGDNPRVFANYEDELKEAIKRYCARNVKQIYFLKDPSKDWALSKQFSNAISESISGITKYEELSIKTGYNDVYKYFIEKFKKNKPNHELYVCDRDSVCKAVVNAIYDLGYKIPNDIEILGVIGTKQSITSRPTISSIKCDLYEVGGIATRMLTKMFNGTLENKDYIFKTEYIKRESTLD